MSDTHLRTALIRLASTLPQGSTERRQVLDILKTAASLTPIESAQKGDRVEITYRGEKVTGKVVRVKKDGVVTVDLSGQHSDEDVGYVDVRPSKKAASEITYHIETGFGLLDKVKAFVWDKLNLRSTESGHDYIRVALSPVNLQKLIAWLPTIDPHMNAYVRGPNFLWDPKQGGVVHKQAAKAPAKLKGKKLDDLIEKAYYKHGNGVQINMMAIPKIFKEGVAAYEAAATPEEGVQAVDEAMKAAVAKYRQN